MKCVVCAMAVALGATVQAKTVSLWTFWDYDSTVNVQSPTTDARDAFGRYDLTRSNGGLAMTDRCGSWSQPPNPDTDADRLIPAENQKAILLTEAKSYLNNAAIGARYMMLRNDFTLEGWIRLTKLPGDKGWLYVAGCIPKEGDNNIRPILSLRNNSGAVTGAGRYSWQMYIAGSDQQLYAFPAPVAGVNDPEVTALTNGWHHLALTFQVRNENGKSEWTFFWDGVRKGSTEHNPITSTNTGSTFYLGGRGDNGTCAAFDYWRLSDEVLTPDQFLNAGGAGTTPVRRTVAYWPLGHNADGTLDTRDVVGACQLSSGLFDANVATNRQIEVVPSPDCAFAGNPPNTTVSLPDGNAGCMQSLGVFQAGLSAVNLGRQLDATNSFTVEGWFKLERRFGLQTLLKNGNGGYLFNTRGSANRGWALQIWPNKNADGDIRLGLYVQDIGNSYTFSGNLREDIDWHHTALVRDLKGEDEKGTWCVYLDDVQIGCITDPSEVPPILNEPNLMIGGRPGTETCFQGKIDCVRVSRIALAPEQFLNATENAASVDDADVLAFWPLNASGISLDGRDLKGTYNLTDAPRTANQQPVPDELAPVVSNPDATDIFRGDPARSNGSAAFNVGSGHARAFLSGTSREVCDRFLNTADAYTFECYVYRTEDVNSTWELIFASANRNGNDATGVGLNFTYRNNGFVLWDTQRMNKGADTPFPNSTANDIPLNAWTHIALTYKKTGSAASQYECFVNGKSKGVIAHASAKNGGHRSFMLGGRPWSGNSFKGRIAHVRLSRGALEPSEFLCAEPERPISNDPFTLAYWPLDAQGETLDLSSRVEARYGLQRGSSFGTTGAATASESARRSVPNPDATTGFDGNPKANAGSVTLTQGHLTAENLGLQTDVGRSFTVEGWLKWRNAGGATNEMVCGTFSDSSRAGWKLEIDKSGAFPSFAVYARGYGAVSVIARGSFGVDVSEWEGTWHHLALVCDPYAGDTGEWRLFLDGKAAGTPVANFWRPCNGLLATQLFGLGSVATTAGETSCLAGFDMWRVSRGALEPDQFLFAQLPGTFVIVR